MGVLIAGEWHFIEPVQGMIIFDRAADNMLVFRSGWKLAAAPALPTGGAAIDVEGRAATAALIQALKTLGVVTTTCSRPPE